MQKRTKKQRWVSEEELPTLQFMQKGGKVKQLPPQYVDSKNDPRYRAYQDSLYTYNKGANYEAAWDKFWGEDKKSNCPGCNNAHYLDFELNNNPTYDKRIQKSGIYPFKSTEMPVKYDEERDTTISPSWTKNEYAEPVQPVEVRKRFRKQMQSLPMQQQNFAPNVQQPEMYNAQMPYTSWHEQSQGMPYYDKRTGQMAGTSTGEIDNMKYSYKYGGRLPGTSNVLDTRWNWATGNQFNQQDPYRTGNTLQPVDRQNADIEAERGETILGDFDGDGQQEHMNIGGEKHYNGGTPLNVPDNSFVFSDTKALKVKDPLALIQFGSKKPATPAELAKKYDLNKFKALVDNPASDNLTRKTAQMMYDNNLAKLNSLASHQEQMKQGMEQQKMMKFGGTLPQARFGVNWNSPLYGQMPQQDNSQYISPYSESVVSDYQNKWNNFNNYLASRRLEGYKPLNYNPNVSQALVQDYNAEYPDQAINTPTISQVQRDFIKNGNNGKPISRNDNWVGSITSTYNYPDASNLQSGNTDVNNIGTIGNTQGTSFRFDQNPVPGHDTPIQIPGINMIPNTNNQVNNKIGTKGRGRLRFQGPDANTLGDLALGLKVLNTRKYTPWEAPVNSVIPQVTFESDQPIRNAISEQANAIADRNAYSGNSRAARANNLALQGQVGAQAQQAVGEVGNRNVQVSNQGNAMASQIMNQEMQMDREKRNRLYQGNVIAQQQYDNSLNNLSSELVGRAIGREDNASKRAWNDVNSKYFTSDAHGMPVFKNAYTQAMYEKDIMGMHPGESTGNGISAYNAAYENAYKNASPSMDEEDKRAFAKEVAGRATGMDVKTRRSYDANNNLKSYSNTQQYGGPIAKYSIGGEFIPPTVDIPQFQQQATQQQPHMQNTPAPAGKKATPVWAAKYLVGQGIPAHIAAGIVGNIAQESGFNPGATNPTSGAFGLGQWLGKRKDNLYRTAAKQGVDPMDLTFQLNYMINEPGESKKALKAAMNAQDPNSAAVIWADVYERAGKAEMNYPKRTKTAASVYSALNQEGIMQYGGTVKKVRITKLPS